MTTRDKLNLKEWLKRCANKYGHGGLLGLTDELIATYEENENEGYVDLGNILAGRILGSNMISFRDEEQESIFYRFWVEAVEDIINISERRNI